MVHTLFFQVFKKISKNRLHKKENNAHSETVFKLLVQTKVPPLTGKVANHTLG